MKKSLIIGCCMMATAVMNASAQSSTKSPYSQFGIGNLSDRSQGMSRGMNGVGIALQQGNMVNTMNPASYGRVDSLTMIFDAGVTGQLTNFKEGATQQNAKTASFDYIVASFRAWRNIGVSVGVLPLSNVGYSYQTASTVNQEYGKLTESYNGEGGLHEAYIGFGWHVLKPLSIGFNAGYVWGDLERSVQTSNSNFGSLMKNYSVSVKSYKFDIGMQWSQPINKNNIVTLGATMGIGHKLNANPKLDIINVSKTDTTSYEISNGLELPWSVALGLAWQHRDRLTIAADAELQQWSKTSFPTYVNDTYTASKDLMKDRLSLKIGTEWVPNANDVNHYLNRVRYRFGVGITTPYYKIGTKDGPKDFSISAGFGFPIQNAYNSCSILNISGQFIHSSAKDLITENMFRINIGITFNERWFAKWKVE